MKVFSAEQIRACDNYTIENEPIASVDLMERAAKQLFKWVATHYSKADKFVLFAGTGNNGGDALTLCRLMYLEGFSHIKLYFLNISCSISADCHTNFERLEAVDGFSFVRINKDDAFPEILDNEIVIDGIFGSGLSRPVLGYWAELIDYLNKKAHQIIAIDIPSGLFSENNIENSGGIIKANRTLSFQFPKKAFFFAENYPFVGQWEVLDIGLSKQFIAETDTSNYYLQKRDLLGRLKVRSPFDHKGTYGHAFLIAGSYQKMGAAILAARACLRSGVGLLTVHVPQSGYEIMQTAIPEAMLCIDETEFNYCNPKILNAYAAIGIGPGIGKKRSMFDAIKKLLEQCSQPLVLDADALNILSENDILLSLLPKSSILTPHPGEFDRLTRKHDSGNERLLSQKQYSIKHNVYVVLKGANTSVTTPQGKVYFNSTGNAGMATAGSGDVLTGIILSLLAQGYSSEIAALLGVYLHGLAGDIAAAEFGKEALIASDIINNLGNAFKEISI